VITTAALRTKFDGREITLRDDGMRGAGRLIARLRGAEGWQFAFQYFDDKGQIRRYSIGA
jgi:hypothetical protein